MVDRLRQSLTLDFNDRAYKSIKTMRKSFTPLEWKNFRVCMCLSGAIICGSTVIEFFGRKTFKGSDVDVCVIDSGLRFVAAWLLGIGYTFQGEPGTVEEQIARAKRNIRERRTRVLPGVAVVLSFKRKGYANIQLMGTIHNPIRTVLAFPCSKSL